MTHYEHRRLLPPSMICMAGALMLPGVLAYRDALGQWWEAWPVHLLFGSVVVLWYLGIARHSNRHVRVDDEGLWVDGELAAAPKDILALGATHDPFWGGVRLMGTHLPWPEDDRRRSALRQSNWTRLVEAPGIDETAVVTRERDLARGSWLEKNVVVVTDSWYGRGLREAWILASYRPSRLADALSRVAPHARPDHAGDPPAPLPGAAAPDLDERAG